MLKKILLFLIISTLWYSWVFAKTDWALWSLDIGYEDIDGWVLDWNKRQAAEKKAALDSEKAEHDKECAESGACLEKSNFTINVNDFSPGMDVWGNNTKANVDNALLKIIQTLMVGLWSVALLIMTIGAGYMIFYHGQDDLLSKGKSIFTSGILALVIALSSYFMVDILSGILF